MDRLAANDDEGFIFHQDGAPLHWKRSVRAYLNENLLERWIGGADSGDSVELKWPS